MDDDTRGRIQTENSSWAIETKSHELQISITLCFAFISVMMVGIEEMNEKNSEVNFVKNICEISTIFMLKIINFINFCQNDLHPLISIHSLNPVDFISFHFY